MGRAPDFASLRVTRRSSRWVLGGSKAAAFSPSSLHKSKTVVTLTEKACCLLFLSIGLLRPSCQPRSSLVYFTRMQVDNVGARETPRPHEPPTSSYDRSPMPPR